MPVSDLSTWGPGNKRHIALSDFYFGTRYIYTAKLVQFRDVYVPVFPTRQTEAASSLRVLVWIRNDRNSNQPLIQSEQDLHPFITEFNRHPASISGVLRKATEQVQSLTAEAYLQLDRKSLLVLWARDFPTESSVAVLWGLLALCLLAAVLLVVAYRAARVELG